MTIIDTNELTEAQEREVGLKIAAMCGLKAEHCNEWSEPRYALKNGYADKTAIGLARTVFDIVNEATKQTPEPINWIRIKHDLNGNPRYVCRYYNLLTEREKQLSYTPGEDLHRPGVAYALACKRANKIGGRKYHKNYGGGIVFQTYDPKDEEKLIREIIAELEAKEKQL